MKPTTTTEKVVLPDPEGTYFTTNATEYVTSACWDVCVAHSYFEFLFFDWRIYINGCDPCIFLVIEQEKGQQQLISGIENFDTTKLKHAETCEKNPLPTKEVIEQEKSV